MTFTEEILNKKLHFLCSVWRVQNVDRILIYYKTSGFLPDHFFKKKYFESLRYLKYLLEEKTTREMSSFLNIYTLTL